MPESTSKICTSGPVPKSISSARNCPRGAGCVEVNGQGSWRGKVFSRERELENWRIEEDAKSKMKREDEAERGGRGVGAGVQALKAKMKDERRKMNFLRNRFDARLKFGIA